MGTEKQPATVVFEAYVPVEGILYFVATEWNIRTRQYEATVTDVNSEQSSLFVKFPMRIDPGEEPHWRTVAMIGAGMIREAEGT